MRKAGEVLARKKKCLLPCVKIVEYGLNAISLAIHFCNNQVNIEGRTNLKRPKVRHVERPFVSARVPSRTRNIGP